MQKKRIVARLSVMLMSLALIGGSYKPVYGEEKRELRKDESGAYLLTEEEILSARAEDYEEGAVLRWDNYKRTKLDLCDGRIPVSKLNDPVYCSMNLPSEIMSDWTRKAYRQNGHIHGTTQPESVKRVLSWGGIYQAENTELPEHFSVYLGTIKLFAYSKSQQCWLLIDNQPHTMGNMLYELPWTLRKSKDCQNITYYDDYVKVDLSRDEINSHCLHFWGKGAYVDKEDYLYYASAYTFWTDESVAGKLCATSGIDSKDGYGTVTELFFSRGIASSTEPKVVWGHTISNEEYDKCKTAELNDIYRNSDSTTPPHIDDVETEEGKTEEGKTEEGKTEEGKTGDGKETEGDTPKEENDGMPKEDNIGTQKEDNVDTSKENRSDTPKEDNVVTPKENSSDTPKEDNGVTLKDTVDNTSQVTQKASVTETVSLTKTEESKSSDTLVTLQSPVLKKPVVNRSKRRVKVKWKKEDNVSGYQVEYSTDKRFKKASEIIEITGAKKGQKTFTLPQKGKKYYIRIRSFVKKGDVIQISKWSKKKMIKM